MSNESSPEHIYSQRLGVLTAEQFQRALTRFGLGAFVGAAPVSRGLFGQNVFVQSSQGAYVLRGAPHYPWQFPKECFAAKLIHQYTQVPVAHPYLLDPSTDIFGWPYLLMPRLPGKSPAVQELSGADRLAIAQALGQNLAQLHELTWPEAGRYDSSTDTIQSFREGLADWLISDIEQWLAAAQAHGAATTRDDIRWIEHVVAEAQAGLVLPFQPCFVMNDYNPGNILVQHTRGTWEVSGLFDFLEYYVGDGEADLMRLIAIYLGQDETYGLACAQAFANAYFRQKPARPEFDKRYALYMLRDRLIIWEYGTRPENNWFSQDQSFRDYAEPFTTSWRLILPTSKSQIG